MLENLAVQSESGIDDFVDLANRERRRSESMLPFYRREQVLGAVITAAILYMRYPSPFAVIAAAVAGSFLFPWYKRFRSKRDAIQFFRSWAGDQDRILVRVELRPNGLWVAQHGVEILYPWRDVVGISRTDGVIEFALKYGMVVVRSRGFRDEQHINDFLTTAQKYQSSAGV